jgi:hypothetical protein
MTSTDPDKNSASTIRQVEVRLHRETGINSTTVLAFNNFINRDADLNATLTGTARLTKTTTCFVVLSSVLRVVSTAAGGVHLAYSP